MRISVDSVDGVLFTRLATPPIGVGNKEKLVLGEVLKARKILVRLLVGAALPRLVRGRQTTGVGNVLAQR